MSGPVSSPRFIGRDAELAALDGALDRAERGEAAVALIAGESGIGKSRLIAEFSARARARGATVLVGECLQLTEGELPYAAIVSALRELLHARADGIENPDEREGLEALLHDLGSGAGARADTTPAPLAQARLFERLLDTVCTLARRAPTVLILEDLHWADRSTGDFVAFLVRNTRRERLVLLASYRSEELHRRHPLGPVAIELQRSGRADLVNLLPFARDELVQQLTAILAGPPEAALVERLLERSDGNPFFVEELVAAAASASAALPESLRDALLLRVERLSAGAQSALEIAAVAGRVVDDELLSAVSDLGPAELADAFGEAVDGHILVHRPGAAGYAFRHALLQEAVYADLLPARRRALHVKFAEALTARPRLASPGAAPAELAHHWYAAGEFDEALAAAVRAGLQAESVHALAEALSHYDRALEIWDRAPGADTPLDLLDVIRRAAEAESLCGDPERSVALARRALGLVDERVDPVTAALLHERLGRYLWRSFREADGLPEYRRAVELVPAEPPSEALAVVLAAEGQALMLAGRHAESLDRCNEAVAIARQVGAAAAEASALNSICPSLTDAGEYERAVEATVQARAIARRLMDVDELCRSYVNGSDALDRAGRVEQSIALAREGIEVARELGADRSYGDFLRAEVVGRLQRSARWPEADRLLHEMAERPPVGLPAAMMCWARGMLAAERGQLEAARADIERSGRLVSEMGAAQWLGPQAIARVTLQLLEGRAEAAAATVRETLSALEGSEMIFYTDRLYDLGARALADLAALAPADHDLRTRHEATARALLERLDERIAELAAPSPYVQATRSACAAELTRIGTTDPLAWRDAGALWRAAGDEHQAAYAAWRQAEAILAGDGDRGEARDLAREAFATAVRIGARPLEDELRSLARRARLELDDATAPPGDPHAALASFDLTPRERDVLPLLAAGYTNREIAGELFISDKTASVHVSRILSKLGVRNRAEAAATAHRLGLTSSGD
jgi:DNA-binding CsgD family transcriptional regulator/tetratricopeptide (TPR) repeat protein